MMSTSRLAWLLIGVMMVLAPMAWASPVDPSWIKGIYDDADFDDVVTALTTGNVAVPTLPARDLIPVPAPVSVEPALGERPGESPPHALHLPRAPPVR